MELTEEQEKEYIESGGVKCPQCNSSHLNPSIPIRGEQNSLIFKNECLMCGARWQDVYRVVEIRNFVKCEDIVISPSGILLGE